MSASGPRAAQASTTTRTPPSMPWCTGCSGSQYGDRLRRHGHPHSLVVDEHALLGVLYNNSFPTRRPQPGRDLRRGKGAAGPTPPRCCGWWPEPGANRLWPGGRFRVRRRRLRRFLRRLPYAVEQACARGEARGAISAGAYATRRCDDTVHAAGLGPGLHRQPSRSCWSPGQTPASSSAETSATRVRRSRTTSRSRRASQPCCSGAAWTTWDINTERTLIPLFPSGKFVTVANAGHVTTFWNPCAQAIALHSYDAADRRHTLRQRHDRRDAQPIH